MSPREQCEMLLRKAAADEGMVDKVLDDPDISDELVGFHWNGIIVVAQIGVIWTAYPAERTIWPPGIED